MAASSTAKTRLAPSGLAQFTSVMPEKKYSSRQKSTSSTRIGIRPIHRVSCWCMSDDIRPFRIDVPPDADLDADLRDRAARRPGDRSRCVR